MKAFTLWTRVIGYQRDSDGIIWVHPTPCGLNLEAGYAGTEDHDNKFYCATTVEPYNFRRYPHTYYIT